MLMVHGVSDQAIGGGSPTDKVGFPMAVVQENVRDRCLDLRTRLVGIQGRSEIVRNFGGEQISGVNFWAH